MKLSEMTKPMIDNIMENSNFTEEEYKVALLLSKGTTLDGICMKTNMSKSTVCRTKLRIDRKVEKVMEYQDYEKTVPIWQKLNLTVEEAAMYSNIGQTKLRELMKQPFCGFVISIGNKTLIKRKEFEEFIRRNNYI